MPLLFAVVIVAVVVVVVFVSRSYVLLLNNTWG